VRPAPKTAGPTAGPAAGPTAGPDDLVGTRLEVDVGPVAHGGHCVARHEGRVVFVRHALPGERVVALVTDGGATSRFLRADAVEVLTPSPDRVASRCPVSGPGGCGGCDWQHADLTAQRRLKADVVREQLVRLGGIDPDTLVALGLGELVEPVPGDVDGLAWRTRVRHSVAPSGLLGLHAHRSHRVVELPEGGCSIAAPGVQAVERAVPRWPGARAVDVVAPSSGPALVLVEPAGRRRPLLPSAADLDASLALAPTDGPVERVRGRTWVSERVGAAGWQGELRVSGSGFWQVHPGAAATLTDAVLDALDPREGEQALDLYSGVGLFAAALADRVGTSGAVLAVEGDEHAVRDARRTLHGLDRVAITAGRVDAVLSSALAEGLTADLVVLDPPREGAGRRVVEQVVALAPQAIAYVACDPAALARDVRTFADAGYRLAGLRAFDAFPMTHHIECVAHLVPVDPTGGPPPPESGT
jgi:tRNA/tmRNA/rRNA uracil-C5-methylase (TrmA/RlmC/RlmD family)